MKRILLSVFAAAITAAWAVPSNAADVTFGGQYRLRGEMRNNADFDKKVNDNTDFWDQRVRLTTNVKATDDTSIKITLQDSRRWGAAQNAAGGPALTDSGNNTVDLHESYVNVDNLFGAPVSLRAGRQELNYGDERLVGSFGWNNNGRSFDALKFMVTTEPVNVDIFTSKILEGTGNITNTDLDFHGIYATVKAIPMNTLDLYVLALRDGNHEAGSTPFGISGQLGSTNIIGTLNKTQTLYTYGARLKGAVAGVDYTLEVPFQTGNVRTTSHDYKISAFAYAAKVGYTLPTPMNVHVGVEYDFASGDKDNTASNDKIKTFFNLFPTNHDKLGLMDQQAWRNVKAWNVNVSLEPTEKLRLYAAYWDFRLAQKEDAWYAASNWNNTPTNALRKAISTESNSGIGNEIDLVATYKYNNALTAELGYSRFMAGKMIKDRVSSAPISGEKADQNWSYLMLTANF